MSVQRCATERSRRFDGHKAAIVVDTDSQLITAVEVFNAPDNLGAMDWWNGVKPPVCRWRRRGRRRMATAIPGRPSPRRTLSPNR